jgi:hypothetical protein
MATILIDGKDFLAGESQWDYITNAGFSPDSYGLNLFLKPGVLNFGWTSTDRGGATLTGAPIASAYDKNFLGNDTYLLDDGGAFYTLKSSTFTKRQTAAADTFSLGTSDLIQFKGDTYATSATRVTRLTGSDLATIDSGWWTGLNTAVRHPLEVVEDKLFIGDLNLIHSWDGTTSTASAITLPSDCNVTSLRRHPDGRHLIAFTGYTQNFSHQVGGPAKIYIINKDTLTWEREILIDNQVEGSRSVGGIVYVTYGKKLGYFTGSGIRFLKQLKTSTTTYSHSMTNMEDILLVRDGTNVLAYGDLGNGSKTWHNINQNVTVNTLTYKGQNLILVGGSSNTFVELDYGTPTTAGMFVSKRYVFNSMVKIRRMDIIHDQKASGSVLNFSVYYRDTDNSTTLLSSNQWQSGPSPSKTRIECDVMTDVFQLQIQPSQGILGIKMIRIEYEPVRA